MTSGEKIKFDCILLIDDDPLTNFINSQLINNLKITDKVGVAKSGKDALDYIFNYSVNNDGKAPDLIILDINMPEVNGFDFLKLFKSVYFKK